MLNKQSILYRTLTRALSLKRPHMQGNSPATKFFTQWLFMHLPDALRDNTELVWQDQADNLHVDLRTTKAHRTLFVAHVDTVHKELGPNKLRKTQGKWYADGAPLGADDGAGCAMLMHLIHSKVPGYYIFTQGEEVGGVGALFLATQFPGLLGMFDRAIAFDRRGIDSVITHQGCGRCCSDTFAQMLSDELNAAHEHLMYLPDNTGVYTDTAEFVDIIPECTNISVGYDFEHSQKEELDIFHFKNLAAAVLKVRWDNLPTSRNPLEPDPDTLSGRGNWWDAFKYPKHDDLKHLGPDEQEPDWDSPEYTEKFQMFDAIDDAREGKCRYLLGMVAELVYPEDPDQAERFMDRNKLTPDILDTAEQMLDYMSAAAVACELFDEIYRGDN